MTTPAKAGSLRRGYVYLGQLDKLRPLLVISPDVRNERGTASRSTRRL